MRTLLEMLSTAEGRLIRTWLAVILGPAVTLIGFIFIFIQLRIAGKQAQFAAMNYEHATKQADEAQRWRKAEFLATQVTEFFADKTVDRVVRLLDWGGGRKIKFEEDGKPVMSFHTGTPRGKVKFRDDESNKLMEEEHFVVLDQALLHHSKRSIGFTDHEARVRDEFDWFLLRLGQFQSMIDSRLFTYGEVEVHLEYVLDLVSGGGGTVAPEVVGVLDSYIADYDFKPAARLVELRREKRKPPSSS